MSVKRDSPYIGPLVYRLTGNKRQIYPPSCQNLSYMTMITSHIAGRHAGDRMLMADNNEVMLKELFIDILLAKAFECTLPAVAMHEFNNSRSWNSKAR